MSAEVIPLAVHRHQEVALTYDQFRIYLHQTYGMEVSKRWLQQRRQEGMPFFEDAAGRRRFYPSEATAWLEAWASERGRKIA